MKFPTLLPLTFAAVCGSVFAGPSDLALAPELNFSLSSGAMQESAPAHHHDHGVSPAGVHGDHVHPTGSWMLTLETMHMHMDGIQDGTSDVSDADLFGAGFMVAPQDMDMDMLMLMGMYGLTDETTLMLMSSYKWNEMNMTNMMGANFSTQSEGMGDTSIGGLTRVFHEGEDQIFVNFGVSLPTGSTNARDATPANPDQRLGYNMQLGTGTFDLLPGVTWTRLDGPWTFGAQTKAALHLGRGEHDYSVGDRIEVGGWAGRSFGEVAGTLRLNYSRFGAYDGQAGDLNPAMAPPTDPALQGGQRLDAYIGLEAKVGQHQKLALEFGLPAYQNLDGPMLAMDSYVTVSYRASF